MPDTQIRFTTNGLLLGKKFDIVKHMMEIGNCVFKIAFHRDDPELEEIVHRIFEMYDWEPVTEYGIQRWRTGNNVRFHVKRPDIFWKTFKGDYRTMSPHDSDPALAFDLCCQQTCPLLYDGKIYKCSTSGLLKDTLERFNYPNKEQWLPYITNGIGPNCSDLVLQDFLDNFGKPNQLCSMCPTVADTGSKIIHLENVSTRKVK